MGFNKIGTTDRFCVRQLGCELLPWLPWAECGESKVILSTPLSLGSPLLYPLPSAYNGQDSEHQGGPAHQECPKGSPQPREAGWGREGSST